jgi:PAS domain S-box-containing protein
MQYMLQNRRIFPRRFKVQALGWRITSAAAGCAAMVVAAALFLLHRDEPHRFLLSAALLLIGFIVLLHGRFLQLFRGRLLLTSVSLENREQKLRSVFESAPDAMLVLDDQMFCHEANPAALKLFGVGHEQLVGRSISLFGTDRAELLRSWERLMAANHERGQLEMMRADGAKLAAEFTATSHILPGRHLLVLQDATQRLQAEQVKSQSLIVTRAALREASALRSATLALTQSPHLNPVLDALLITLRSLVPYETAQVLLLETPTRIFLAREVSGDLGRTPHCPEILDSAEFPALQGALVPGEGFLIRDTQLDDGWIGFAQAYGARSWLGVPLFARDQVIGLLGVMHAQPEQFTAEHLRLAACLAIPATVAIENARLYEHAEIYSAELEKRLADVRRMEQALKLREDWQRQREIN